jgi:hypothetical protein
MKTNCTHYKILYGESRSGGRWHREKLARKVEEYIDEKMTRRTGVSNPI